MTLRRKLLRKLPRYIAPPIARSKNAILLRKPAKQPFASEDFASGIALLALCIAILKNKIAVSELDIALSRLGDALSRLGIAIPNPDNAIPKLGNGLPSSDTAIPSSDIALPKPCIALQSLRITIFHFQQMALPHDAFLPNRRSFCPTAREAGGSPAHLMTLV